MFLPVILRVWKNPQLTGKKHDGWQLSFCLSYWELQENTRKKKIEKNWNGSDRLIFMPVTPEVNKELCRKKKVVLSVVYRCLCKHRVLPSTPINLTARGGGVVRGGWSICVVLTHPLPAASLPVWMPSFCPCPTCLPTARLHIRLPACSFSSSLVYSPSCCLLQVTCYIFLSCYTDYLIGVCPYCSCLLVWMFPSLLHAPHTGSPLCVTHCLLPSLCVVPRPVPSPPVVVVARLCLCLSQDPPTSACHANPLLPHRSSPPFLS